MTPAPVDVANEDGRHAGRAGEAEIGDVAGAQIGLGRRTGAFDDDEIGIGAEPPEAFQHPGEEIAAPCEVARGEMARDLPLKDDLAAGLAFRLQQNRVHVDMRLDPGGASLKRLGPPDLAVSGGGGVVRHVLWLERPDLQPAIGEQPAQPRDDQRLADIGAGAEDHDRGSVGCAMRLLRRRASPGQPGRPRIPNAGERVTGSRQIPLRQRGEVATGARREPACANRS